MFLALMLVPWATASLNNPWFGSPFPYGVESGDVDGDGDTDSGDLYTLSMRFGATVGDPNYDPNSDLDTDGDIDVYDLYEIGMFFGTYEVTVHVQDSGGSVFDAWVIIEDGQGHKLEEGFTDIDGNYPTCLEDGEYLTVVTHRQGGVKDKAFTVPIETYILVEFWA